MTRVPGWHNFEPDLRLIHAQCVQLAAQATALSRAISEILCIQEGATDGEIQRSTNGD